MNSSNKLNIKDLFLNLGATIALYTVVISLVNLLFTIINYSYPQTVNGYNYYSSYSISWPVAALIIVFPILILLMWVMEREYKNNTEDRNTGIHRFVTYLTLFISGLVVAGDLITVLYYFLDGQELTTGFLLKVLVLLVISLGLFFYYLSDIRGTLTSKSRKIWRVSSGLVIVVSIVLGFSVLGSPQTQRLIKYDDAKVNDLMNINQYVISYYQSHSGLPGSIADLAQGNNYFVAPVDPQSGKPYEYILVGQSAKAYQLCAEFNKSTEEKINGVTRAVNGVTWAHPAGRYCFTETIDISQYPPIKR